ncbi:hypothetical protein MNBD_ALPHA04-1049, partial [hydrothermal vent metagenome]
FALCVCAAIAGLSFNLMPLVTAAWHTGFGYGEAVIGQLSGIQLLGFLIGIATSPFWLRHISCRAAIGIGLLAQFGLLLLIQMKEPSGALAVPFFTGLCTALVSGTALSTLARSDAPERNLGLFFAAQMALALVVILIVESGYASVAIDSLAWMFAFFAPVGWAMLSVIPGKLASQSHAHIPSPPVWRILLILMAIAFFLAGILGIWSFLGSFDTDGDMRLFGVNLVALSLFASFVGSLAAAWLGEKIVPVTGHSLALAMLLGGIALLSQWQIEIFAFAGITLLSFAWNFSLVFANLEIIALDASGRLVALVFLALGIGGVLATTSLGWVLEDFGITSFLGAAALLISGGFVMLFWAAHLRRQE